MKSLVNLEQSRAGGLAVPEGASRLSIEDQQALERAMRELERTSLAIRLSSILGRKASAIGSMLPANIAAIANRAAEAAVRRGLDFAMRSLRRQAAEGPAPHAQEHRGSGRRRGRCVWYFEPAGRIAIFDDNHAALDCRHWPRRGAGLVRSREPRSPASRFLPLVAGRFGQARPSADVLENPIFETERG